MEFDHGEDPGAMQFLMMVPVKRRIRELFSSVGKVPLQADPSESKGDPSEYKADPSESKADPSESKAGPSESKADPSVSKVGPSESKADPSSARRIHQVQIGSVKSKSDQVIKTATTKRIPALCQGSWNRMMRPFSLSVIQILPWSSKAKAVGRLN